MPIGFSTMMRERGVTSPSAPRRFASGTEEVGRGREIKGADAIVGAEHRFQIRPSGVAHGVDRDEVETGEKSLKRRAGLSVDDVEISASASLTEARNASRSR